MVDLRDTLSDHLGGLESLAKKIPGYSGYKEKEMRREADDMLRKHLARQFAEQLTRAEDVTSQMLTGPGIAQLDDGADQHRGVPSRGPQRQHPAANAH